MASFRDGFRWPPQVRLSRDSADPGSRGYRGEAREAAPAAPNNLPHPRVSDMRSLSPRGLATGLPVSVVHDPSRTDVLSFDFRRSQIKPHPVQRIAEWKGRGVRFAIDAILNASRGSEWETATMLGYFCGMRLGDACRRRWSEVDLDARTITWTPEKTARKGKSMMLPLHPRLAEHLKATAGSNKVQGFLTPRLAKGKPSGRSGPSQQFTRLMMKAGVKFDIHQADEEGAGRARSSKSFHSLRHALNSQLLIAGVDEAVRVQVSGHSDARTNRRYSHVRGESFRTALNKLPGKPNGPKT